MKEAEQMVMPYINDELTDKELGPFLNHIYSCKSCYEELEIYYTLYAGLSQLDGENEGQDMRNLLQEALHVSEQRIRGSVSLTFIMWRLRCLLWRRLRLCL